jgi:integrase
MTMNNALIPLRAVFAHALADHEITIDPTLLVKNSKVQTSPPDPLELDEVDALLAHMRTKYHAQVVNYFEVAIFTGMRPSEQIALRWTDFATRSGELRVQRACVWGQDKSTTKTHVVRDIELNERALAALLRQKAHTLLANGAIFHNPHNGEPWSDGKLEGRYWNVTACARSAYGTASATRPGARTRRSTS